MHSYLLFVDKCFGVFSHLSHPSLVSNHLLQASSTETGGKEKGETTRTLQYLWAYGNHEENVVSNMISFQFHVIRDMNSVLDMEPWHFNKHIVLVLNNISKGVQPLLIKFSRAPFWIIVRCSYERKGRIHYTQDWWLDWLSHHEWNIYNANIQLKIFLDPKRPIKRGTKIRVGIDEPC